jgi:DNA polymerase-3 subunit delta
MNRDVFEGADIPAERIIDAANTLPFLSEGRLVIVRDSRLFTAGRKDETEAMVKYIPQIPETTLIVFVETESDKRNRLYKKVSDRGRVGECKTPAENELIPWVGNVFKKKNKTINRDNTVKLLHTVMHSMTALYSEADKLCDFIGEREEITGEDIETVCSPSLEVRVFELVAAIANGNGSSAYMMFNQMLLMKESPIMILTMVARQFRLILQCMNCVIQKKNSFAIAKELGLRNFIVDECIRQCRRFTVEKLLQAVADCQETDIKVKTGLLDAETGVELLIARYAG